MNGAGFRMIILLYRKSSIKPPGGSLFISDTFEGGGAWWRRGLIWEGVVMQFSKDGGISSPAIKNYNTKSEVPVGKYIIPDQSTRPFAVVIDYYSLSFIS